MPTTSSRMAVYHRFAPALALRAIDKLRAKVSLEGISHLVVASCTGFVAPGTYQIIANALRMTEVERTLIGFMGLLHYRPSFFIVQPPRRADRA
jgi:predicted naringenin-chalcone synthase